MNEKILNLTINLLEVNHIEKITETEEERCIVFFADELRNIDDTDYIVKLYYFKKENNINILYYNPKYYKERTHKVTSEYGIPQETDKYITCNIKNINNKTVELILKAKTRYETLENNLKNFLNNKNLFSVLANKSDLSDRGLFLYIKDKAINTFNINLYDITKIYIKAQENMEIKLYYCGAYSGFKSECCIDFKNLMKDNNLELLNIIKQSLKQGLSNKIADQLYTSYYEEKNNKY